MRARIVLLISLAGACGRSRSAPMYPAGSDNDDGYGELAQSSAHLLTSDGPGAAQLALRHPRAKPDGDPYGGDAYGGAAYGDSDEPMMSPPAAAPSAPPARH